MIENNFYKENRNSFNIFFLYVKRDSNMHFALLTTMLINTWPSLSNTDFVILHIYPRYTYNLHKYNYKHICTGSSRCTASHHIDYGQYYTEIESPFFVGQMVSLFDRLTALSAPDRFRIENFGRRTKIDEIDEKRPTQRPSSWRCGRKNHHISCAPQPRHSIGNGQNFAHGRNTFALLHWISVVGRFQFVCRHRIHIVGDLSLLLSAERGN